MAINKKAKNIRINVRGAYTCYSGEILKIADRINIESTKEDLTLISNKKIISQGNTK